jgi:DNA repair protein RadD
VALHRYWATAPEIHGYVTAPTGSGKTVLIARFLEDLRLAGQLPKTMIVVPTSQLRTQTAAELAERGFKGTICTSTSANYIGDENVRIITYNAFGALWHKPDWKSSGLYPKDYGLLVFDEAHHLQGAGSRMTVEKKFTHAKKIGFTATPDYDTRRQLSHILPDVIWEISTKEGVEYGLISPYVTALVATVVDLSGVKVNVNEYDQGDLDKTLDTQLRNQAIARFIARVVGGRRTQLNVGQIHHAESLAEAMRSNGVRAAAVHGKLSSKVVQDLLDAFYEGEITAVTQAQLLGEGFNNPRIEVVGNVRPTLSMVKQKQRVGRGQRTDPDNPDKNLVVIEFVDRHYRKMPLLYGHPDVAGAWQLAPDGLSVPTQGLLEAIGSYEADGLKGIIGDEAIEQWWNGENRGSTEARLSLDKARQVLTVNTSKAVSVDGSFQEPAAEPKHRRPRKPKPQLQEFDPPARTERQRRQREALYDLDMDATEEAASAYDAARSLRKPAQQTLVNYVLSDGSVHDPDSITDRDVRTVLKTLAGTEELKDPDRLLRYQKLNALLHGNGLPPAQLLRELTKRQKYLPDNKLGFEQFRPEGAACNTPQDHDVDVWRDHMNTFFPKRGESSRPAKQHCVGCVALQPCLEFALTNGVKFGVWGGMSERERRQLRKVLKDEGIEAAKELIDKIWHKIGSGTTFVVPEKAIELPPDTEIDHEAEDQLVGRIAEQITTLPVAG